MTKSRKNPGVAAVLSFLFPGAGQIYNEQIWQGFGLMVLLFISMLTIAIGIGVILVPIIWIIGIYDALNQARKINDEIDEADIKIKQVKRNSAPPIPAGYTPSVKPSTSPSTKES